MRPLAPTPSTPRSSTLPWVIAASAITFTLGVSGAMFFVQNQKGSQIEMLTAMLLQMQQQQQIQQPLQSDVTRAATPDLMAVAAPVAAAPEVATQVEQEPVLIIVPATPLPELRPIDLSANARARAENAIADPNFDPNTASREQTISVAIAGVSDIAVGILDGDYTVTSTREEGQPARLELDVANREATEATLEVLLARAAANGDISLQQSVSGSDGKVDPQTLLFDLVQRALENGSPEEVTAAAELRKRAFEASSAQSEVIDNVRYYTVESGDSLAYIALQFYGSTNAYGRIFEANRDLIPTPDQIQIGQRLVIPNV